MDFPFTGVIAVDKPRGISSRRVVDAVTRALSMRAVGHAGTLDPLASGVMIVCVGHATKLVDHLHMLPKHYSASFLLGRSSPSDDFETPIEVEENPPQPSHDEVEGAANAFRGEILQRPCDYSAVHGDGKRAYRLARKGRTLELEAKRVRIESLVITDYQWPRLAVDVVCSSGTYIRALGRDLAESLGTKAVMESLVRSAVGPFTLGQCVALEALDRDTAPGHLRPPLVAAAHLPRIDLDAVQLALAVRGGLLQIDVPEGVEHYAAVGPTGELVGILKIHSSGAFRLRPNFFGLG